MGILQGLLSKLGLENLTSQKAPVRVFLLDDDTLRHEWFSKQFRGDHLDLTVEPARALALLSANYYDLVFLDPDLLPEHYHSVTFDDERSAYAVARCRASHPDRQAAAP